MTYKWATYIYFQIGRSSNLPYIHIHYLSLPKTYCSLNNVSHQRRRTCGAAREHILYSSVFDQDVSHSRRCCASGMCDSHGVQRPTLHARVTTLASTLRAGTRPAALQRLHSLKPSFGAFLDISFATRQQQRSTPERYSPASRQFHTPPRNAQNRIRRNQDYGTACTQTKLSSVFTLNSFTTVMQRCAWKRLNLHVTDPSPKSAV